MRKSSRDELGSQEFTSGVNEDFPVPLAGSREPEPEPEQREAGQFGLGLVEIFSRPMS